MTPQKGRYMAFLLRLWQAGEGGSVVWHASLEDPLTRERKGFLDLPRLIIFLEEQTQDRAATAGPTNLNSIEEEISEH